MAPLALRAIVTWTVVSGCTHPDSAACNLVADQGQIRVDLTAGMVSMQETAGQDVLEDMETMMTGKI